MRCRTPGWSPMPSTTTGSCTTARARPGTCATAHVRDAAEPAGVSRPGQQGDRLGAQLPRRRLGRDRDGRARRTQHRPPVPRGIRRTPPIRSVSAPTRHGRGGVRLGRADGDQDRPARAADSYERLCHETGVRAVSCCLCAIAPTWAGAQDLSKPRLERAIGVIYRPETELHEPLFPGRSCRGSSTNTSGSTRPRPSRRSTTAKLEGLPDTYPFGL